LAVNAERLGIEEVNFTFEGHSIARDRGVRVLNHEELKKGDVSLTYTCLLKDNSEKAIVELFNRSFT
jgi:hypothetical protein|tara:strand:+ start:91 stop:291 length:201 start_codon:yes stop_codon:yes gene_type:complete